jgi:hypothetical protein
VQVVDQRLLCIGQHATPLTEDLMVSNAKCGVRTAV